MFNMINPQDSPFLHACTSMEQARVCLSQANDVKVQFGKDVCSVLFFCTDENFIYQVHASKLVLLFGAKFNSLII